MTALSNTGYVDGGTAFTAVERTGCSMFPLHEPDGLHRIALFLPSCSLLGLYTFRFCLTACLFCLPAYFLRSTGGILALPFLGPHFIGTLLFRRGGFCQSCLTALVCGKELLRVDQFWRCSCCPA